MRNGGDIGHFCGNRGDMGTVHGNSGDMGPCSWGTGKILVLLMANRGGVGPGQGSGTGEEGVLLVGVTWRGVSPVLEGNS